MAKAFPFQPPLPVGSVGLHASGVWAIVFLMLSEASLFAYLFFAYFYVAVQPHPSPWPPGGPPSFFYAAPQTAVVLLASGSAWWAQRSIARGGRGGAVLGLAATLLFALGFTALQFADWIDKPFTLATDPYGSLYFVITGIHLAHVVVGAFVFLAVLVWSAFGYFGAARHTPITVAAIYWYFVALLWLGVFLTLYVTPYLS